MTEPPPKTDLLRACLSMLAAAGMIAINLLAAKGWINGVSPAEIARQNPTMVTPAWYSFSIWTLIYVGVAVFAVYQLVSRRYRPSSGTRTFFILSCALNCAWIFLWVHGEVIASFAVIVLLLLSILLVIAPLREPETYGQYWVTKAPFELYGGWVTALAAANFAALLASLGVGVSESLTTSVSIVLILLSAAIGIIVRLRFRAFLFPLAVAWASAAIGVRESGHTLVVSVAALALIASLIACLSVILTLPTQQFRG